jgi:hypothetical protein
MDGFTPKKGEIIIISGTTALNQVLAFLTGFMMVRYI